MKYTHMRGGESRKSRDNCITLLTLFEYSIPTRKIPYVAAHNMLLAHANVYRMYVREFKETQQGQLGITVGGRWYKTFSKDPKDIDAVRRALDWTFNWTVAPIFGNTGDYPESMKKDMHVIEENIGFELLPRFTKEERAKLKGALPLRGLVRTVYFGDS
ncbi:hypothetical protein COOONC_26981 [Cooperia oncophora]